MALFVFVEVETEWSLAKSEALDLFSVLNICFIFFALQFKDEARCCFETSVHCGGS